jgi:hypothetical protein
MLLRINTAQRLRKGRVDEALFGHYMVVESARFRSRPLRSW